MMAGWAIVRNPFFFSWRRACVTCFTACFCVLGDGRVDPFAEATRVVLDDDYMLLLWRHDDKPNRLCDIFWIKQSHNR